MFSLFLKFGIVKNIEEESTNFIIDLIILSTQSIEDEIAHALFIKNNYSILRHINEFCAFLIGPPSINDSFDEKWETFL